MIGGMRSGLLAASLLVGAPAMAASPEGGRYVWVPTGTTVVLVPIAQAPQAVDFPVARLLARQDALMQRMMADMDTMLALPMPDPTQMIRSVMQGMPQVPAGSGVVMTSITTGKGTCSQTITYGPPGAGGQKVVKVSSSGDACGAIGAPGPIEAAQPASPPQVAAPAVHERLWTISNPPRLLSTGKPPRT